eukprot:GFUD01045023.1.p1 GENE.GFUD01045023.1~~GFUD01045023.1.p1  ORF type:complete len:232 (+),score=27.81 GFUD01045023.1:244-939(+)
MMDKYRSEKKSQIRAKYIAELPRVNKPLGFYQRMGSQANSLDALILVLDPPKPLCLTLKCPLSLTRQTIPARTVNCQHLETFDLSTFLDGISFSDLLRKGILRVLLRGDPVPPHSILHTCPICSTKAPLYIDTYILSSLTLHPDLMSVTVSPGGHLTPPTPTPDHPCVDLTSPPLHTGQDTGTSSPLPTPDPVSIPTTQAARRRFSFGDLGCRLGRRYQRLSTVDLTDSPC